MEHSDKPSSENGDSSSTTTSKASAKSEHRDMMLLSDAELISLLFRMFQPYIVRTQRTINRLTCEVYSQFVMDMIYKCHFSTDNNNAMFPPFHPLPFPLYKLRYEMQNDIQQPPFMTFSSRPAHRRRRPSRESIVKKIKKAGIHVASNAELARGEIVANEGENSFTEQLTAGVQPSLDTEDHTCRESEQMMTEKNELQEGVVSKKEKQLRKKAKKRAQKKKKAHFEKLKSNRLSKRNTRYTPVSKQFYETTGIDSLYGFESSRSGKGTSQCLSSSLQQSAGDLTSPHSYQEVALYPPLNEEAQNSQEDIDDDAEGFQEVTKSRSSKLNMLLVKSTQLEDIITIENRFEALALSPELSDPNWINSFWNSLSSEPGQLPTMNHVEPIAAKKLDLKSKLDSLLQDSSLGNSDIFRQIFYDKKDRDSDDVLVRVLVTSIIEYAIEIHGSTTVLNEDKVKQRADLLQLLLDDNHNLHLVALNALQTVVCSYQNPPGVLCKALEILYEEDLIPEMVFLEWYESSSELPDDVIEFVNFLSEPEWHSDNDPCSSSWDE